MSAEELAKPENLEKAQTYIDFIKKNLEPLAQHLQVGVDWLWDILVKQAQVEALVYLSVILLLVIKSTILLIIAYKAWGKATFGSIYSYGEDKKTTNREGYLVYWCGALGVAGSVISMIVLALTLPIIITGLVNPEYRAIEKIVDFAKPKVSQQENK